MPGGVGQGDLPLKFYCNLNSVDGETKQDDHGRGHEGGDGDSHSKKLNLDLTSMTTDDDTNDYNLYQEMKLDGSDDDDDEQLQNNDHGLSLDKEESDVEEESHSMTNNTSTMMTGEGIQDNTTNTYNKHYGPFTRRRSTPGSAGLGYVSKEGVITPFNVTSPVSSTKRGHSSYRNGKDKKNRGRGANDKDRMVVSVVDGHTTVVRSAR